MTETGSLWGGRFQQQQDGFFERFNASLPFDRRLFAADIEGSRAYARGLEAVGTLTEEELAQVQKALDQLESQVRKNPDLLDQAVQQGVEDIHSFVEAELTKLIGDTAKKIHTGRSRNDQVATDLRLYLRKEIDVSVAWAKALQKSLLEKAESDPDAVIPGYTHLQRAQPLLWGHYLLSYFEMLGRDVERLIDCRRRVNRLPLGSGALAGNSQGVDREKLAEYLCFDGITFNSLDATSDRDFVIEFLSASSTLMMHLSRLAEDLILYCTDEFGFVVMSDKVATGSSLMPQKKNPDALELIRGKTGRVYGNLMGMLTVMKGLPSCYNKDMQEDKEGLFDTIDTVQACLRVMKLVVDTLQIKPEVTRLACEKGYLNATDLADYLARKGIPFRSAHHLVGEIVLYAVKQGKNLDQLTVEEYQQFSDKIDASLYPAISLEATLNSKSSIGGTATKRVKEAITAAHKRLAWNASLANEDED
ncbi:MAG: argininosuccinate lyase [Oligoflexus sp.]